MVRQLARQVLGAHQVQPLCRAHSGPQLLGVWGLQVGECSGGLPGESGGKVQGGRSLCAQGRRNVREGKGWRGI